VCVHLCMQRVRRGTQGAGMKRMKTQLTLRVHEDVAARHERLLLHADACQQSAVRLAGSAEACSSCRHYGTGSSRSHSARQCSHRRRLSLRRVLAGPPSARTSVYARFTLFSHVVWFRSMISPGSAPARTALSSLRTTLRRPLGAPLRAPSSSICDKRAEDVQGNRSQIWPDL